MEAVIVLAKSGSGGRVGRGDELGWAGLGLCLI